MLKLIWDLTRGYRFRPWRSPYLQWRLETYSGIHAGDMNFREFLAYCWGERKELLRYLRWAERMR